MITADTARSLTQKQEFLTFTYVEELIISATKQKLYECSLFTNPCLSYADLIELLMAAGYKVKEFSNSIHINWYPRFD